MDLTDVYRTLQPKTAEYTFFLSAYGTFSRAEHTLGHKTNHNKFKKTEIISSIFWDHNLMRLENNFKEKKTAKNKNSWKINKMLLNNPWVTEEIKEETKNTWRQIKMKIQ